MKESNSIIKVFSLVILSLLFFTTIHNGQTKGGRWNFENNGNDEAVWDGVDNTGNLAGSASFSNIGAVIQGSYYLSIEDSANYGDFTISDNDELDFFDENFAASMWFYPVKGYDNPQHLLMKGDRSGSVKENNYALRINDGYIEFIVHAESGSKKSVRSSYIVVENEWNFVAVYYDYTNSKLYLWNEIESAAIDTFDFNAPLFPNNDKLYIGSSGENGFKRFWGRIDDVRISNKESDVLDFSTNVEQPKMGGSWTFENNGNDEAIWDAVDNNGTLAGNAFYDNTGSVQQGNYYLSIEDSANYGDFIVPDHEELDFLDENFAASMWYYPVKGYDKTQHLVMKGDRSGAVKNNNYAIRINGEFVEFIVHSESGANKVAKSSYKVVEYQWNFIAVFYDFVNSKLYFWNDAQSTAIDTFDFNAPLFPNNDKLYLGSSGENGFKRFWGRIDDVRISNKESDVLDISTNVEQQNLTTVPNKISLEQNYPNPFNPSTTIEFFLSEKNFTKLDVYNVIGEHVKSIVNQELDKGEHEINFNATNLPSGIYFYKLEQGTNTTLKKMVLLK